MGEKRAFYRDPLAAAWMAKHFGMRLTQRDEDLLDWMPLEDAMATDGGIYGPYYVHPNSLYLLEPRVNDFWAARGEDGLFRCWYLTATTDFSAMPSDFICIQRGGIAFHWPEFEP